MYVFLSKKTCEGDIFSLISNNVLKNLNRNDSHKLHDIFNCPSLIT